MPFGPSGAVLWNPVLKEGLGQTVSKAFPPGSNGAGRRVGLVRVLPSSRVSMDALIGTGLRCPEVVCKPLDTLLSQENIQTKTSNLEREPKHLGVQDGNRMLRYSFKANLVR